MARRLTALTGFGALAASLLLLAGCASTPQGSTGDDIDDDRDDVAEFEVDAAWLDDGRVIGIVTEGSSTCVPTAEEPTYENGLLAVTLFDADPEAPCTRDLVPRVTLVSVPEGVDPTQPLQITVAYNDANGDTDLDGVAGLGQAAAEEGTPSAGWAGDDTLVLVTYGSGSRACYPIAESVAVAGGVVTVTMAEPAADQVCTMDFVPQGTVIHVEDGDDAAELVLTGYGFDDVRVPILGTD